MLPTYLACSSISSHLSHVHSALKYINEREKSPELQFKYQTLVAIHRRKIQQMAVFSQSVIPINE
jgi:hypothetical protein